MAASQHTKRRQQPQAGTLSTGGGGGGPAHQEQPRATPRLTSGTAAQSARWRQCRDGWRSHRVSEVRAAARRSYPAYKASGGQEETPHVRGQGGGREELRSIRGQWWPGGDTPCPRSGAAGRRHPASEVRGGREKPLRARGQWQ